MVKLTFDLEWYACANSKFTMATEIVIVIFFGRESQRD